MVMDQDTIPWFKQPLVWLVISFPLTAVLAGIVTIYIAVSTDDGLVVDDYYKQGLAINRKIELETAAKNLQLTAEIVIDSETGFVKVNFDKGMLQSYPDFLYLTLNHATQQQRDKKITLQHGIGDQYAGSVKGVEAGMWHLEIIGEVEGAEDNWRLAKRVQFDGSSRISLRAE